MITVQELIYNMLQNDGENAEKMMIEYSIDDLLEVYGDSISNYYAPLLQ